MVTGEGAVGTAAEVEVIDVGPDGLEAAITASPAVSEAAVVVVEEPGAPARPVAYVVPRADGPPESVAALRRRLLGVLPAGLVPADVVLLERLPREPSGAVDGGRLPAAPRPARPVPPADDVEDRVAEIWAQVLGLPAVGRDADLLALGADPSDVEDALAQLREAFGVRLLSGDLVANPTVGDTAALLRRHGAAMSRARVTRTVLRLTEGAGLPVFCFAGAGALALSFMPLARRLGGHPVHGFQTPGLEGRARPDHCVTDAADRCVRDVRRLAGEGPCVLVGHSYGGLVALETARRLRASGTEVPLVVVLDTFLPGGGGGGAGGGAKPGLVQAVRDVVTDPYLLVRRLSVPLAGRVRLPGKLHYDAMFRLSSIVADKHDLAPYDGRVLLVLGQDNPDGPAPWTPMLQGPHEVVELDAHHNALLREPQVSQLARRLADELVTIRA